MDPIRGTNVSLDVALIALKADSTRNSVALASAKLALDTQEIVGNEIVKMIENLGNTIDTYV
jgi:hypothetical protein